MTTVTATQARANLTRLLQRAARGEDVGIVCGADIIALRPTRVFSEDYALREYGVSESGLKKFTRRIHEEIRQERKAGTVRPYRRADLLG